MRAYGATEVFPPEDADVILDNTATGATLSIPLRGGVTLRVPVDGGRPQILWWLLDDGMARALIPAARG